MKHKNKTSPIIIHKSNSNNIKNLNAKKSNEKNNNSLNFKQTILCPETQNQSSKQHKKLIEYRDFLLGLRKMDLGKIINENRTNKNNQKYSVKIQLNKSQPSRQNCLKKFKQVRQNSFKINGIYLAQNMFQNQILKERQLQFEYLVQDNRILSSNNLNQIQDNKNSILRSQKKSLGNKNMQKSNFKNKELIYENQKRNKFQINKNSQISNPQVNRDNCQKDNRIINICKNQAKSSNSSLHRQKIQPNQNLNTCQSKSYKKQMNQHTSSYNNRRYPEVKQQTAQIQANYTSQIKTSIDIRIPINKFNIFVNNELKQDDLYCDEDMQELMSMKKPITPKLLHLNNYHSTSFQRDYSTHRSSRCRDFSMPSIQQRNLSEQSQKHASFITNQDLDCKVYKQRNYSHSLSGKNNKNQQKKYNSYTHTQSVRDQYAIKQNPIKNKQTQAKINSFKMISCQTNKRNRQNGQKQNGSNSNKKLTLIKAKRANDKQNNLVSTNDRSVRSGNNSARYERQAHVNNNSININPFNFNLKIPSSQLPNQRQKIQLNVSQIVRRINNRQIKSSMSDRSYKRKAYNTSNNSQLFGYNIGNQWQLNADQMERCGTRTDRNILNINNNLGKQKIAIQKIDKLQISFDNSKLLKGKCSNLAGNVYAQKKRLLRSQAKQFISRQKSYLMMKLKQ